jgi:hypothetical protein
LKKKYYKKREGNKEDVNIKTIRRRITRRRGKKN